MDSLTYCSAEMRRVLTLPKKQAPSALASVTLENLYRKAPAYRSIKLNEPQTQALCELYDTNGLLAFLPVGWGKTLIGLLAPQMLKAERPLYLTKASGVEGVHKQAREFDSEFFMPLKMHVASYEGVLSRPEGADLLTRLDPDLIVLDEAHLLCYATSARTKRLLRFFFDKEKASVPPAKMPKAVVMSGTLTKRSVKDYYHLAAVALKMQTPLPVNRDELDAWATILDSGADPVLAPIGLFKPMVEATRLEALVQAYMGIDEKATQSACRQAFQQHLESVRGVVVAHGQSVDCSLEIALDKNFKPDEAQSKRIEEVQTAPELFGMNPPTEVQSPKAYEDYIENFVREKSRQLVQGFQYIPHWAGEPDMEWLNARARFNSCLRRELEENAGAGYDSPYLVCRAIDMGNERPSHDMRAAWEHWKLQRHKPEPGRIVHWASEHFLNYTTTTIAGLAKDGPLMVWCQFPEFGERLARHWGLPWFGQGTGEPSGKIAVASITVHGSGHNLQQYSQALVVAPLLGGAAWEQLLGRHHRQGQAADSVQNTVLLPSASFVDKWKKALEEAKYLQETTGQQQKLLFADVQTL